MYKKSLLWMQRKSVLRNARETTSRRLQAYEEPQLEIMAPFSVCHLILNPFYYHVYNTAQMCMHWDDRLPKFSRRMGPPRPHSPLVVKTTKNTQDKKKKSTSTTKKEKKRATTAKPGKIKDSFYRSKKYGGFVKDGTTMRGLLPFLSRSYFGFHTTETLRALVRSRLATIPSASQMTGVPAHLKGKGPVKNNSRMHGMALGVRVHRDFERFYSKKEDWKTPRFPSGKAGKLGKTAHNFSRAVLRACNERGWKIVNSEVGVHSASKRTATKIDIVCTTPTGAYVILELKTGSTYTAYRSGVKGLNMSGVFAKQLLSEAAMHQIQLLANVLLFQSTFPSRRVDAAYVVLVTEKEGVQLHALESWALAERVSVLKDLDR